MIQLRLLFIFVLSTLTYISSAQENCTNGIDDDADGLIDLQDPDCSCNGIDIIVPTSLFPNPSFEVNTCSPGFSRAHCADGWVNPSQATPDYYDRCDMPLSGILPVAACPIPDGDKFFGISDQVANGSSWKEYVGTQLVSPMLTGTDYILSFWIGFVNEPDPNWSSPSVDFAVYGNTSMTSLNVPFDGTDCPTSVSVDSSGTPIVPWQIVEMVPVTNTPGESWKQMRVEFTATSDFVSILLGPSCTRSNSSNYYFLDNIVLSERSSFSNDFISVRSGQACNNDLILEVPIVSGLDYQWYRDDLAMVGQTGSILNIPPLPAGNGVYTCVISNAFGCSMSESFVVDETGRIPQFVAPTGMCPGEEIVIALADGYNSYDWGALGNNPDISVTIPDQYSVTVVDGDGCRLEATYDLRQYDDVQYTYTPVKESAPGASDGSIQINHEIGVSNPAVTWWDASNDNPKLNLEQGIYCGTVTADERCAVSECIDLELELQPVFINAEVEDVRCFEEENGQLEVQVTGGVAPFSLTWQDHPEWQDQTLLQNLPAGTYRLTLRDAQGTVIDTTFQVGEPAILLGQLASLNPTCHDDSDGSIWLTNVSGGNGGYQYYWNDSPSPTSDRLDDIRGDDYHVLLVDAKGCELTLSRKVLQPAPISAQVSMEHSYCHGADDGSIHVEEIIGGTPPFQYFLDEGPTEPSTFNLVGDKNYRLLIQDMNGCEFAQDVFISNQKDFTIDLGPTLQIEQYYRTIVRATSSLVVANYSWSSSGGTHSTCPDCSFFELKIENSELIVLHATSLEGCIATDSVFIEMTPSKRVYIPNAFSPNGDGINDDFELFNVGEVERVSYFKVFNRQGVKLFDVEQVDTSDALRLWNASVEKHKYNPGAYIYMIGLQFKDGTTQEFKGDISVIH